jgi:hypothetical protein
VLDQAERIAAEARAPYVGTEHLVVAILWMDTHIGAQELRRQGVGYARALERLATLPATERAEAIDPLEEVEVPTPAAAMLGELARQQAKQHPIEGGGRISSMHHLLALLMLPRGAAGRLLRELGVDYEEVVRRIEEEGSRRVQGEDWRPEELPVEGWRSSESPTSRTRRSGAASMPSTGSWAGGGPLHVRQEHGRPGMVAGTHPSRCVGSGPTRGARPSPRPWVMTTPRRSQGLIADSTPAIYA